MFFTSPLRRPPSRAAHVLHGRPSARPRPPARDLRRPPKRPYATSNPQQPPPGTDSRVERILSRLPPSWQRYTAGLRSAPVSHVVAFLLLHELTAVAPLLGLFGLFHYSEHAPLAYMMDHYGENVQAGARRFERYFRRKGWFGFGAAAEGDDAAAAGARPGTEGEETVLQKWEGADAKYKVVVEVALAYAITKALLPVRIMASLWATPWFAGVLGRARSLVGRRRP